VHHGVAGAMMMLGVLHDDPILWRHGYLLESGYEIADLFSIFFNLYPYRQDGMKPEIKIALIFHHLPGILLSAFVLEADLHYNTHLREIGMWLLLGACQSCVGGVFIYCLNFELFLFGADSWSFLEKRTYSFKMCKTRPSFKIPPFSNFFTLEESR
jgi:hypothetical protein